MLVENNVDSGGATTDDHFEIALSNTGTTELGGFEVYYTFDDRTAAISESYYAKLPDTFIIAAGATRIAHFDDSGAPDHFGVNDFSLYKRPQRMPSMSSSAPPTLHHRPPPS